MEIKTFYFNPYRECTYVVSMGSKAIIIDPGMYKDNEWDRLYSYLCEKFLRPSLVLITHTHPDHICGIDKLLEIYPSLLILGESYKTNNQIHFPYKTDGYITGLDNIEPIYVIHTPGHKSDSVCYLFPKDGVLFTGDTLFQESVGRTDLPEGDFDTLMGSLKILFSPNTYAYLQNQSSLSDWKNIKVYPGHGYETTLDHELKNNPFINFH